MTRDQAKRRSGILPTAMYSLRAAGVALLLSSPPLLGCRGRLDAEPKGEIYSICESQDDCGEFRGRELSCVFVPTTNQQLCTQDCYYPGSEKGVGDCTSDIDECGHGCCLINTDNGNGTCVPSPPEAGDAGGTGTTGGNSSDPAPYWAKPTNYTVDGGCSYATVQVDIDASGMEWGYMETAECPADWPGTPDFGFLSDATLEFRIQGQWEDGTPYDETWCWQPGDTCEPLPDSVLDDGGLMVTVPSTMGNLQFFLRIMPQ